MQIIENFRSLKHAPRTLAPYIGMKTRFFRLRTVTAPAFRLAFLLACLTALTACAERFPSGYLLELPSLPESWASLLGEPCWRLEWLDPDGSRKMTHIMINDESAQNIRINIPITWVNAVTAWPYWPEHNIIPGLFKPAGAIFPLDVNGNRLHLTWEAGVDTVFFWELAVANEDNFSRLPVNFDWLRFRELFQQEILTEAVCEDPWVVDWRSAAEKTTAGNFDRRRLVPEKTGTMAIPVPESVWHGTSPFAKPLSFAEEEPSIFPVRQNVNAWVSEAGILRASAEAWIFIEWQ